MELKSFKEWLDEAGKTPAKITWNKSSEKWYGLFEIDNVNFEILISKENKYCNGIDVWEFKFTREGSTKMYNDFKYPFKVVPTIKNAMEEFLKTEPDVIGFISNQDDKGRIKMYEKNAKTYSDKFDYKLFLDKSTDFYAFVLYKKKDFLECVYELQKGK